MTPSSRRRLGNVLVAIGVLAWAPFLAALAAGIRLSILPFLAVHLIGVFTGAWLRRNADEAEGLARRQDRFSRRVHLSKILIYLGVLAWAPYFYLEQTLGQDVSIGPFLTAHLLGVLGGALLRGTVEVQRARARASDVPPSGRPPSGLPPAGPGAAG
jgi:hypothetical protein